MQKLLNAVRSTQLWRSVFRHGYPDTPRNRTLAVLAIALLPGRFASEAMVDALRLLAAGR